jgi:hypothetical protein
MTFKKTSRAGQIALTLGVLLGIAFAVFATGSAWAEEAAAPAPTINKGDNAWVMV